MATIMKDAEPFAFDGGDVGVLVLHGFTGSTQSMRYLGEGLHRRFGFTVSAPCLPGHGTSPDDMETTSYLDWLGAAEKALQDLTARKRKVFVTGLSMGGVLTLNLAARFPALVSGIVPISAPAGVLPEAIAELISMGQAPTRIPGIGSDIKAPGVKELAYEETPVACLRQLYVLVAATTDLLHKIACPTLVIHSREDHLVSMANAKRIAASVSSDDVRLLWLNNSYHVSTLDNDKELILQRAGDFFTELARS
jgi:carboxylesterase